MSAFKKVSRVSQGGRGGVVVWGVLGCLCLLNVSAWGQFSGGSGTVGDPFQIATVADMQTLSANSVYWNNHFKMTADIDLTGMAMTPIGNSTTKFTATFDGDGYAINNLSSSNGLFGTVSGGGAEIRDLVLLNPNITGGSGGLVGLLLDEGSVSGCVVAGGQC